jgi:SAM-dependent methyltransferase
MSDDAIASFYAELYGHLGPASNPDVSDLHELSPRFFTQAQYLKSFVTLFDGMHVLELGPNVVSALPALSLFCRPRYYYYDQVESPIIRYFGGQRLGAFADAASIVEEIGASQLDLVFASHSVEHLNPASLNELFDGMSRVLRTNGHIFVEVPFDLRNDAIYPPHTLFFTPASLQHLLQRHGFEIIDLTAWQTSVQRTEYQEMRDSAVCHDGRPESAFLQRLKSSLRRWLLGIPFFERRLRRARLRRGLARALRNIPTPYDSRPFIRAIGRKT